MFQNIESFGQVIEPEPVAFSFDAPGWYILIALIFFGFFAIALKRNLSYRRNAYRREAIAEITALSAQQKDIQLVQLINLLLRQIVLRTEDRVKVAELEGAQWIDYLNQQCKSSPFYTEDYQLFEKAVYQEAELDHHEVQGLLDRSLNWIETYKVQ